MYLDEDTTLRKHSTEEQELKRGGNARKTHNEEHSIQKGPVVMKMAVTTDKES